MRRPVKRKLMQVVAFGYSNIHLTNFANGKIYTGKWKQFCNPGLHCYSCPAATLSCPIGALQAVSGSMHFKFSFYVVGMLLAFGTLFGRFICGYLCPFGLLQELLHKIPVPKRRLWQGFLWIKYFILAIFVILLPIVATNYMGMGKPAFCQYICPVGTLEGGLPLLLTHPELRQATGGLFLLKMAILIITMTGCVLIYRFFCRVLCPLGVIYGLLNKISVYHLEVDRQACTSCGACKRACRMEVDPVKTPDSAECIRCGDCACACPEGAIHLGFERKKDKEKFERQHRR